MTISSSAERGSCKSRWKFLFIAVVAVGLTMLVLPSKVCATTWFVAMLDDPGGYPADRGQIPGGLDSADAATSEIGPVVLDRQGQITSATNIGNGSSASSHGNSWQRFKVCGYNTYGVHVGPNASGTKFFAFFPSANILPNSDCNGCSAVRAAIGDE